VRSSATAEDLPGAAFAGQQETYLNVIGPDALLHAVQQCWASLWSDRAIVYRTRQGIAHAGVRLAVVVQRLVPADVAGVLFTANPVTGARDELVLDASPGLGEAVVSGEVTPDHYRLRKGTHQILEHTLGLREVIVRPAPDGGVHQDRSAGADSVPAAAPALPDHAVQELARLAEAVERHFGAPQDVEWAWAGGQCFLLQARPITALPPASSAAPLAPPAKSLIKPVTTPIRAAAAPRRRGPNFTGELFSVRPYPLDLSAHIRVLLRAIGDAMAGPLGARFPTAADAIIEEDGVPLRLARFEPGLTWRVLYKPWLSVWQRRHYDLFHWAGDPLLARALDRARALEARDLSGLSWREVVDALHDALDLYPAFAALRDRYFPLAIWHTVSLWLLLRLAGPRTRRYGRSGDLLAGVETKTLALNRALERLAALVRQSPALRKLIAETEPAALPDVLDAAGAAPDGAAVRSFLDAFADFLRQYGHRESVVTVASLPSWREARHIPLGVVRALAAGPPPAEDPAARARAAALRAREDVLAHTALGRPPLRGWFLRALEGARVFPQLREDTHFFLTVPLPLERRSILELGRRLVTAGVLDTPDDVFHLTLAELDTAGATWPPPAQTVQRLRDTVARRRARRAALADVPFVDPDLHAAPPPLSGGALLSGTPGGAGVAEGPVRVIRGPAEFGTLLPGEVLVAPFTNPSWTPLFQHACAVVVDTGAAISHAAIVAREYGIPAVMGARGATTVLTTGQRVRVDGTRGLVFAAS
jgi:pyruvate,water dikinase